jgi:hypothetical protein
MEAAVIFVLGMQRPRFSLSAGRLGSQIVRARAQFDLAAVGALGAVLLGCASTPVPCRSPSACPGGKECLAHRCAPIGAEPVDPESQRQVLEPSAVAVVRRGVDGQRGLPPQVTFGGPPARSEQLLVRFAEVWAGREIDTAFLLLEPDPDAEPSAEDVQLDVALAAGDWASGSSSSAPSSRKPVSAGLARTRPPTPLRVDVTAQLRKVAREPSSDHGFIVRASSPSTRGAVYLTGADGVAPKLDVYFRATPAPR